MGTMGIIEVLPIIILGPFIGTLADQLNSKKILIYSSFLQCMFMVIFYFMSWNSGNIILIYILGGLVAISVQFYKVTIFTIIPKIFPDRLTEGNAKISSITTFTDLFAPFVASLLMTLTGLGFIFLFIAVTSLCFGIIVLKQRNWEEVNSEISLKKSNFMRETMKGFQLILNRKPLLLLILIVAISNLGDSGLIQLIMYYLATDFNLSESTISLIIGLSGLGAFLGTFFPKFIPNLSIGYTLFAGLLINNLGIFILAIQRWPAVLLGLFVCNLGGMMYGIAQNTMIHSLAEGNMLGRVNSSLKLLVQITKPISISLLMFTANSFGAFYGILISILFSIITSILIVTTKLYNVNVTHPNSGGN